jgi:haloacetate dehalogenase
LIINGAATLSLFLQRAAAANRETPDDSSHQLPVRSAGSDAARMRLPGFHYQLVRTTGAAINAATRGSGDPLLLLHGYPENHLMWRDVAPGLAQSFTVVCPDLRGYGDSSKPEGAPDHSNYSKRAMAADMVEVMAALGHREFLLAGHDRGGRVAYRLALEHPSAVKRLALLDIVSTKAVYEQGGMELASRYFHWYFLIQQRPFPEKLIGCDPSLWLREFLPPGSVMLQEYLRTFATAEGIHATCEDYRAGFFVDLPNDKADVATGRKITCPTMILWGKHGAVGRVFNPLEVWRDLVASPVGEGLDCGHFIPEERSADALRALLSFFRG